MPRMFAAALVTTIVLPSAFVSAQTLFNAASKGNEVEVRKFLDAAPNASIESTNLQGETALFIASEKGHAGIVKLLATRGARVDVVSAEGYPPFWRQY